MGCSPSMPLHGEGDHEPHEGDADYQDGDAGRRRSSRGAGGAAAAVAARSRRTTAHTTKEGGGDAGADDDDASYPLERKKSLVMDKMDDIRDHYEFAKVLGRGQFGVTRLVTERATGEAAACKSISKRKLASREDVEDVRREIKVMHHLSGHPHVVAFKGAYEDAHHIHIVMELCTGGELFEHLAAKGHYRERDAAALMRTIVSVVAHCHAMNVVHRDLKPENFLFREPGRRHLKAIDFGLSAFYHEGEMLHELLGSPFYMAPEVLARSYGKAADIWSCGVIAYILLCGWPPFYGSSTAQIFRAIQHDPLDLASPPWGSLSAAAKDCVKRMLVRDPRRRATAADILSHEWMRDAGGGGAGGAASAPLQPEILSRLRRFAGMNRLKREALKLIATTLKPEEIEGVRQMFADLDSDGSGAISFEELRRGLAARGAAVTEAELRRIMDQVDLDGNQTLDFQEFLTATVYLGKLERREQLLAAFQAFDADGSGYITEDELMSALLGNGVAPVIAAAILADVDRDDDRRIDYDEFCAMMLEAPPAEGGAGGAAAAAEPQQLQQRRGTRGEGGEREREHSGGGGGGAARRAARQGQRTYHQRPGSMLPAAGDGGGEERGDERYEE